jgi:selenocysteine-specific elongation factor
VIVATAGHVDHGKTSLVKALTQVNTDRLEEEQRRGMSIELGFAYADFGLAEPMGFVDVPGHERFVRNMLAGVAAIDCALLVIAADDGPMPQTLEHLAILELLGVQKALVALTKVDRVDDSRIAAVTLDIQKLLAQSALSDSVIFPVVATTGQGVDALRAGLQTLGLDQDRQAALGVASQRTRGNFRLAIDRAFVLPGSGLVVSGAVVAGRVQVGDRVLVSPAGVEARIRSIHAQNQPTQFATAGQRCALNLSGPDLNKDLAERGAWVLAKSLHAPTQRLDVELKLLSNEDRTLVDGVSVQLHLAATSVAARVALLGTKTIAAGQSGLAQLVLDKPIGALFGDRFVLRDQAAQRTIGGGYVIDPFGPIRGRAKPARLLELEVLKTPDASDALERLMALRNDGLDLMQFECARNIGPEHQAQLRAKPNLKVINSEGRDLAWSKDAWNGSRLRLLEALHQHHSMQPESLGLAQASLLAVHAKSSALGRAALQSLLDEKQIVRDGLVLRAPSHVARVNEKDRIFLERITVVLIANGLRPPIVGELAKSLDMDPKALLDFLQKASQAGRLAAIAANRFYLPATLSALAKIASDLAAQSNDGGFDAAAYRDQSGIGRNSTIQVLEYLDRHGVTRFAKNRRWMSKAYESKGQIE